MTSGPEARAAARDEIVAPITDAPGFNPVGDLHMMDSTSEVGQLVESIPRSARSLGMPPIRFPGDLMTSPKAGTAPSISSPALSRGFRCQQVRQVRAPAR